MLDLVIQFTKIGLEHNLPLNIIKHIISLDHKLIQCDLCKDYSTNIYIIKGYAKNVKKARLHAV
jgi:hypothetical protein